MKKEITKTIPEVKARPSSKKTLVVTYCDFCTKKSADHYGNERKCMGCGRDICRDHQSYDPNESGDYGGYYCPRCLKLFYDKYQKLLYDMQEEHYEQEEALMRDMKTESLHIDLHK